MINILNQKSALFGLSLLVCCLEFSYSFLTNYGMLKSQTNIEPALSKIRNKWTNVKSYGFIF